jgi:hypothetical protein
MLILFRQFPRAEVANLIHLEGQIELIEHHQGPDPVFLSEERPGSIAPPPQTESVTNREKTIAFKPMCLNVTLHQ